MEHQPTTNRELFARLLVWLALSAALLGYILWGSEHTQVTSYYLIVRSVPEIWGYFHDGLPEIGNTRLLDAVYWISIGASLVGTLALLWLALEPEPEEAEPIEDEE